MRVRVYDNRKRGNERQREEFEQMSAARTAALPESEVVNADNTHEWKRTHWGEYDKAPTGNKMYGDVYTINNPESYDRKKRVELKRQIREEFPDAKIKYDNGSISFRVPYVNEDHVNLSLISDDYYTPEINMPVVRIKRMPQMREFEIRQPKSNLWWWTNDNGTVNFVHGDHNNDYYRHPEYNIEVEGIDYNQAYDNSMPEFMDIAYDKGKNVYVYNGNRWVNHYYNSDVAYGKKAKNDYITAQDLINNGYKIFKYPEQYKNSSIYQKEKNEFQKYFDKIELLNKVNKESKLHNTAFGYEPLQQVYNNGGVLDATYNEQINRIRQPRFAGWRMNGRRPIIKSRRELLDRVNNSSVNFVERMKDANREKYWFGDNNYGTHLMSWATQDGRAVVYPKIQEKNGELVYYKNDEDAIDNAIMNNDVLYMTPREARWFTKNYKKYYPEFADGGIYIKEENRGKFTQQANNAGMGVQEFAKHVLANKDNYSSTTVKRANFARNATKFNH